MIKKTIPEKIIVKTSEIKLPEIGEIMLTNQDEKVMEIIEIIRIIKKNRMRL
tara:strand:- start:30 stop:185 length:156 start_codon:yes stop_codon:yes gene_type:complete